MRGKAESLKQNSWDSVRVWWAPILARGKLHVEMMPEDFPGECPAGAAVLVSKVRSALNLRFQGKTPPRVLFVNRGKGFYTVATARITQEFNDALRAHGLRAFMGQDARQQPGSLQEVMLHETAVAWLRSLLSQSTPRAPAEETRDAYLTRLRAACAHVNDNFDVAGLNRELPGRVQQLLELNGDKLRK